MTTVLTSTVMMAADCAAKCPKHAVIALVGTFVIGLLIGFFLGRRGSGNGGCKCAGKQQRKASQHPRPPRDDAPMREPIPAGSVEIYVGNLSYDLNDAALREMFEKFGTVSSARVVINKHNEKSKGFGFVVMPVRAEAEAAIAAMSEKEIMGRKMRVNEAKNTIKEEA